jgi:hypothetical protein
VTTPAPSNRDARALGIHISRFEGMGLQGYVGSAADQARIRRLEKEREEDRERIDNAKKAASSKPYGFRTWEKSTVEVVENAFKKETVGLVTREEYIEKKSTIQTRLEVCAPLCPTFNLIDHFDVYKADVCGCTSKRLVLLHSDPLL